ncbi:MAG: glutathione S-transferase family protein [Pseudomonadota bacterium]
MSVSERIKKDVLDKLVGDINARLTNKSTNRVIGDVAAGEPRFELYHGSLSLCSFKCRTTLAEAGVAYTSHAVSIMPSGKAIPLNYRPEYVRLRLKGQESPQFVSGYSGASAVGVEGFDPCVVPTLVDHGEGRVIIDSKDICAYIDAQTGHALIPPLQADEVNRHVDLVDQAPHVALLYGADPAGDRRPAGLASSLMGVHGRKVRALNAVIAHIGDGEPALLAAYTAKIAKETAAGEFIATPAQMATAIDNARAHVGDLQAHLSAQSSDWVCGDSYTMADIVWTISLYRLMWLGYGDFWAADTGNDKVADYYARAIERPSFKSAVRDWKYAHGPSDHLPDTSGGGYKAGFLLHMLTANPTLEAMFGSDIKMPKH